MPILLMKMQMLLLLPMMLSEATLQYPNLVLQLPILEIAKTVAEKECFNANDNEGPDTAANKESDAADVNDAEWRNTTVFGTVVTDTDSC